MISIDGTSGAVYLGEVAVVPSPVVRYFEGELSPDSGEGGELVRAVQRIMTHADAKRPAWRARQRGQRRGPRSVHFFHEVGLDYVSCSPFRVPVARLEAGRAAIDSGGSDTR